MDPERFSHFVPKSALVFVLLLLGLTTVVWVVFYLMLLQRGVA